MYPKVRTDPFYRQWGIWTKEQKRETPHNSRRRQRHLQRETFPRHTHISLPHNVLFFPHSHSMVVCDVAREFLCHCHDASVCERFFGHIRVPRFVCVCILTNLDVFDIFLLVGSFSFLSALVDLYDSTNGPFWVLKANWMDGDPCTRSWNGVICDVSNSTVLHLYAFDRKNKARSGGRGRRTCWEKCAKYSLF